MSSSNSEETPDLSSSQIRISLGWENGINFDKVQRIRCIHKAQMSPGSEDLFTIKDQIVSRAKNPGYFLTNKRNTLYTDLDRLNETYGNGREHIFYFYFSPHTDKDLWFDLNNGEILYIVMTDDLLNTDFTDYSGEMIAVKPSLRRNQLIGTVAGNKYLFALTRQGVRLFGANFTVSFLTTQKDNNSFKITTELASPGITSYLVRDEYSSVPGALTWEGGSENGVEFIFTEMNVTDENGVNRKLSMLTTGTDLNDENTYILSHAGGQSAPKLVKYEDVSNFDDIDIELTGNNVASTNNRCGPDFLGTICPGDDQCCNRYSWCGVGSQWCSVNTDGSFGGSGEKFGWWEGKYDSKAKQSARMSLS
jgi:hypothetical protein